MQYSNYYDQMNAQGAVFNGAVLLQASAEIGGQKHVYFNLKGAVKEAFRYPPIGGIIANPFPGPAKIYAGDLVEHSLGFADNKGGTIKILKSYAVAKATSAATDTDIYIVHDGYHHIPFIGDKIMVGQKDFKTKGTGVSVTAVEATTDATAGDVWKLTLSAALGALTVGQVLVEAAAVGSTLPVVTNPNCFAPHDYDMPFYTLPGSDEYEKPRLMFTPCLLGPDAIFIKDRMSPLPPAVEAMNISRYPELFYTNY